MTNSDKLYQAFSSALNIELRDLTDDTAYQSIPEWDSISHMVLISTLEEAFDVSLDTDDVIDMSSVGKAKEILEKHNIFFT
jgi:acyl carrier protein